MTSIEYIRQLFQNGGDQLTPPVKGAQMRIDATAIWELLMALTKPDSAVKTDEYARLHTAYTQLHAQYAALQKKHELGVARMSTTITPATTNAVMDEYRRLREAHANLHEECVSLQKQLDRQVDPLNPAPAVDKLDQQRQKVVAYLVSIGADSSEALNKLSLLNLVLVAQAQGVRIGKTCVNTAINVPEVHVAQNFIAAWKSYKDGLISWASFQDAENKLNL